MRCEGFLWTLCTLCLLAGCGDRGPPRVVVEGTVTLDGNRLANKGLMFVPEPRTPGQGAGAFTDRDGEYSLIAVVFGGTRDYRGITPGRYRVMLYEPLIPIDGAADDGAESGEPAAAIGLDLKPPKSDIPAVYRSEATTPLLVEIPESGGKFDFELTSKGPWNR